MSRYTVYVVPDEFRVIKRLPGNVRQRVKRAINELTDNPRPPTSNNSIVAVGAESGPEPKTAGALADRSDAELAGSRQSAAARQGTGGIARVCSTGTTFW